MVFTEETAQGLAAFIEEREGMNWLDAYDFAHEVLDFLIENGEFEDE